MWIYSKKHRTDRHGPGTKGPMRAAVLDTGLYIVSDAMAEPGAMMAHGADLDRAWYISFSLEETDKLIPILLRNERQKAIARKVLSQPDELEPAANLNQRDLSFQAFETTKPSTLLPKMPRPDHTKE